MATAQESIARILSNTRNMLNRALFGTVSGLVYDRDQDLKENLKLGYEQNATVFGAVARLMRMFAEFPKEPFIAGTDTPAEFDPLQKLYDNSLNDYTYYEYMQHWYLFALTTGEAITYRPIKTRGGKAVPIALDIMPSQNVEIIGGGWRKPIDYYALDVDEKYHYTPDEVWHARIYMNVDFINGQQFRGLSPISVAIEKIKAMNAGDSRVADQYESGLPPGLLVNKDIDSTTQAQEAGNFLKRAWRKKKKSEPIFGGGNLEWINIGTNSLKDLGIIEMSQENREILYGVWGVSPELFMAKGTTFNNKQLAEKAAYKDRILPDVRLYCQGLNKFTIPAWNIEYKPMPDKVEALQEDMENLSKVAALMRDRKVWTLDEARKYTNKEPIEDILTGEEGLLNEIEMGSALPALKPDEEEDD